VGVIQDAAARIAPASCPQRGCVGPARQVDAPQREGGQGGRGYPGIIRSEVHAGVVEDTPGGITPSAHQHQRIPGGAIGVV